MIKNFLNKPLKVRVLRGFLLALVLSLTAWYVPTPYHLEAPGRAFDVGAIVTVESQDVYPSTGQFLMPTVVSEKATIIYCLYSLFDPEATLQLSAERGPMAQSSESDQGQMLRSQYFAALVAFRALGHELPADFQGLRILQIGADSPNRNTLKVNDLLKAIDDSELSSFRQFKKILNQKETGKKFQATVERDGSPQTIELEVFRPQNRALIGVNLQPEYVQSEFPIPIFFSSGTTSGASGGLVFALEIYNRLTPDDITKGRKIAATGTLDPRGNVGSINGVDLKLKGAQRAGAEVILVPKDNYSGLNWLPDNVEVIPVESFNDALDALRK